jgi:hypothetical protein
MKVIHGRRYHLYHPAADDFAGFRLLPADQDIIRIRTIADRLAPTWKPIVLQRDREFLQVGDFPTLIDYFALPLFSTRAWSSLEDLVNGWCEGLPVSTDEGDELVLVHMLGMIPCLDESKSVFTRNRTTQRINSIQEYVLNEECIGSRHLFQATLEQGADVFVSDAFRAIVEESSLQGLLFKSSCD